MAGQISRENGKKGGRKKGQSALLAEKAREYVAKALDKDLKPIVDMAIAQAKRGDTKAREWLSNYAWGKPTNIHATIDEDGKTVPISGMVIKSE
jgi:hypothetical protein